MKPEEKEEISKLIVENPQFKLNLVDKITKVYSDIKRDDLVILWTFDMGSFSKS
jgi:hypothetical protein